MNPSIWWKPSENWLTNHLNCVILKPDPQRSGFFFSAGDSFSQTDVVNLNRSQRGRTMSHRTQKVASLIKQEIGKLFTNEFADLSPNMITVTQVRMSDDLSVAKVFLSVWGRIEDVDLTFIRLEERKKDIRYELAKSIKNHFRVIPELIFRKDDSQEYSQKIEALFKKIHEEEQNRHS